MSLWEGDYSSFLSPCFTARSACGGARHGTRNAAGTPVTWEVRHVAGMGG